MSLLAVGVSHQTAPVALLEQFAMGPDETVKALHELVAGTHVTEAMVLSEPFGNEIGACFDLNRQVARAVADARARDALPVVLTGNCHTQQAVVSHAQRCPRC